jgi:hypothetical protein
MSMADLDAMAVTDAELAATDGGGGKQNYSGLGVGTGQGNQPQNLEFVQRKPTN